jgi:MoaA/NifB/PqqE/SkfB family radical SAM enzyme
MNIMEKPELVRKLRDFRKYVLNNNNEIGMKQRGIDMNLNNACNLRCQHCFTNSPKGEHAKDRLSLEKIAEIADQAHELGIFEWDLQGGELLLQPEFLFETLRAIKTHRFYMYVTTNGFFMTQEIADTLASLGVNRVSVSIDSIDPEVHDKFRGRKDSWRRAINALEMVQNAGMHPYLNITVGHYNAKSDDVKALLDLSKEKRYTTLVNVATPSGMWQKLSEIMVDDEDKAHLIQMRKEYKNIMRNLWNPFDMDREGVIGCNTVNRLYITPLGDVLPCPYVHIKIGNIFESSLKEISENGFRMKKFRENSPLCLAGEDKDFVEKYMMKDGTSIFKPVLAEEIFPPSEILPKGSISLPIV